MSSDGNLKAALKSYDFQAAEQARRKAEEQRVTFVQRFPLDEWPGMTLEQYAQGHPEGPDSFVTGLQTKTRSVAAVFLGDAVNGLIYYAKKQQQWVSFWEELSPQEAWERTRSAWLQALELAKESRWEAIDDIDDLKPAKVLVLKALYLYFPNDIMPTNSENHMKKFIRALGSDVATEVQFVSRNRLLLETARSLREFDDWNPYQINHFLYWWVNPGNKERGDPVPGGGVPVALSEHDQELFDQIEQALEWRKQLIVYGPPGTGKTYLALRFAERWLSSEGKSEAPAADETAAELLTGGGAWWVVANPSEWNWNRLLEDEYVDYRYGRLGKHFANVRPGDLVVGYQATPDKRIVALARVAQGLHTVDQKPVITLKPFMPIEDGPTYDDLRTDNVLGTSEPIRNRCQGTLFRLTEEEADYLLSLLADSNPAAYGALQPLSKRANQLTMLTFHQSYSYEDFIEGFRPREIEGGGLSLVLTDGVFKRVCAEASAQEDARFLIVIDEINRANVAKVFGETITVLEKDKRDMSVRLPQSGDPFAIPKNVYIIGTMNTADRSIRLLDVALRRRFAFIELMPDVGPDSPLAGASVEGTEIDLCSFLGSLNDKIAQRDDREKQIGHAFLLDAGRPITSRDGFCRVFRQEILPLLQEYCLEDYDVLQEYLGPGLVNAADRQLNSTVIQDDDSLLAALQSRFKGDESPAST